MEDYRLGNPLLEDDDEGLSLQSRDADEGGGEEGEEGQELTIRKAIFTKISAPVLMCWAGDDQAVSEQEAAGWMAASSVGAERVDLPRGGGRGGIFAPANRAVVAELLLRLCTED